MPGLGQHVAREGRGGGRHSVGSPWLAIVQVTGGKGGGLSVSGQGGLKGRKGSGMSQRMAPQVTAANRVEYLLEAGRPPVASRSSRSDNEVGANVAPIAVLLATILVFLCGMIVGVIAI